MLRSNVVESARALAMYTLYIEASRNMRPQMHNPDTIRPFKVAILGASFETNNMGVGALAAGAITSILRSHPEAEVCLVDYSKESAVREVWVGGRNVRVPLMNIRFSKRVYLKNNIAFLLAMAFVARYIPSNSIKQRIVSQNPCLELLSNADVIASLAGGDSFSDIYGFVRLLYVWLPQVLALLLNKNVILLPQTLGPYKSKTARAMARFIIRRAAHVYSRDIEGLQTCRQLLNHGEPMPNVSFCYDVGFVTEPIRPRPGKIAAIEQTSQVPLVGINVSGLLLMGGYTRKNMFGLRGSYKDLIVGAIQHFISNESADVVLIPHVFGWDARSESDSIACEQIYTSLKAQYGPKLRLLEGYHNQNEIKGIIGMCDFFVGARMHSCIAALSQCVPAVAMAYSDKFKGVLGTLGTDALVVDPRTMSAEEVIANISQNFKQRRQLREQLQNTMPAVMSAVLGLFGSEPTSTDEEATPQFLMSTH